MGSKRKDGKTGKPRGKPFPKNVSGNPGGRPKHAGISAAIRHILDLSKEEAEKYTPDTYAEKIALGMIQKAVKKDKPAAEFVANRAEGQPTATVRTLDISDTGLAIDILKPAGQE